MYTQPYYRRWDVLVNNHYGQPTLIVEVKSKINTSSEWVAKLRRNILAHGILPSVPYFLIVFPDKFYLWINNSEVNQLEVKEPDYIVGASSIIQPYYEQSGIKANQITEKSLEIIVVSWLEELINAPKLTEKDLEQDHKWLIDSGLYDALVGGKINYEAVM